MRSVIVALLLFAGFASSAAEAGDVGLQAHWLWNSRFPRIGETIRLRREFTVTSDCRNDLRSLTQCKEPGL